MIERRSDGANADIHLPEVVSKCVIGQQIAGFEKTLVSQFDRREVAAVLQNQQSNVVSLGHEPRNRGVIRSGFVIRKRDFFFTNQACWCWLAEKAARFSVLPDAVSGRQENSIALNRVPNRRT